MRTLLLSLCALALACNDVSPTPGGVTAPDTGVPTGPETSTDDADATSPDAALPPPLDAGDALDAGATTPSLFPFSFGAAAMDFGKDIAVDPSDDSVWVTGYFSGTVDFDPGPGVDTRTGRATTIFLAKYDRSGRLERVITFGGAGPNMPHSVRVGPAGDVTVAGFYSGTSDFDPSPAEATRTSAGGRDAFVAQWDRGGALRWVVTLGAAGDDEVADVAVDAQGLVHVTGSVSGEVDLDPGPGTAPLVAEDTDGFLAAYGPDGQYLRSTQLGGAGAQSGFAIASEPSGAVVVSGTFSGAFECDGARTSAGPNDVFVARFEPSGARAWCFVIGGGGFDLIPPGGVDVDGAGNIVVGGRVQLTADLDPSPATRSVASAGGDDLFLAKYDRDGAHLWSFAAGGPLNDSLHRVRFVSDGSVIVGGWFRRTIDVDPAAVVDQRTARGTTTNASDVLIARYSRDGALVWAYAFGGGGAEEDTGVASNTLLAGLSVDARGATYSTGRFFGATEPTSGVLWTSQGSGEAFVLKLDPAGTVQR